MPYPPVQTLVGVSDILPNTVNVSSPNNTTDFFYNQIEPKRYYLEYFYFTDTSDNVITATAGTVEVMVAADDQFRFHYMDRNANFNAIDANSITRIRPGGVGIVFRMRVILSGVTFSGISSYRYRVAMVLTPQRLEGIV